MQTRTALFTGRFQPPSIAHAATAQAILVIWPRLIIGVADPQLNRSDAFDERWLPHLAATENGFSPKSYIFTSDEVVRMWKGWIAHVQTDDRVMCESMPRVYLDAFTARYPSQYYDIVRPTLHISDSEGERVRDRWFPELLRRNIYQVEPSFRLHNSEIKKLIKQGRLWKDFIPPGAYRVFQEIDGPVRMLTAMK